MGLPPAASTAQGVILPAMAPVAPPNNAPERPPVAPPAAVPAKVPAIVGDMRPRASMAGLATGAKTFPATPEASPAADRAPGNTGAEIAPNGEYADRIASDVSCPAAPEIKSDDFGIPALPPPRTPSTPFPTQSAIWPILAFSPVTGSTLAAKSTMEGRLSAWKAVTVRPPNVFPFSRFSCSTNPGCQNSALNGSPD